ncbi:MAG: hypothetical protein WAL88_00420 [Nitrosotalea sp.]
MTLSFTQFLISYTERFFLKATDALGLSISIFALFISMAAIVMTLSPECTKDKCMQTVIPLPTIAIIMLIISVILVGYILGRHYKNNQDVFDLEKIIFLKSDKLDQLDTTYKEMILDEVEKFYKTKGKNLEKLKGVLINPEILSNLSESHDNKPKMRQCSWWYCKMWNGEENEQKIHFRWNCYVFNGEEHETPDS